MAKRKADDDFSVSPATKKTKAGKLVSISHPGSNKTNKTAETPSCTALGCTDKFRITSWNLNGYRAAVKKGFPDWLLEHKPDVLCVQEVKAAESDVKESLPAGYTRYWNACANPNKKGYAGTAVYCKTKPLNVSYGMNVDKHDDEGRITTVEYKDFYIINTYVPNSGQKLERLDYRTTQWDIDMTNYLKTLQAKKPVIWTGDLNCAILDIDVHNPKTQKSAGFTPEERQQFQNMLDELGLVDVYRHYYPEKLAAYTYWGYRSNAKEKDMGWRLDYFLVTPSLLSRIHGTSIGDDSHKSERVSDHAPIHLCLANE